jgi:hypothetical protein
VIRFDDVVDRVVGDANARIRNRNRNRKINFATTHPSARNCMSVNFIVSDRGTSSTYAGSVSPFLSDLRSMNTSVSR